MYHNRVAEQENNIIMGGDKATCEVQLEKVKVADEKEKCEA